MDSYELEILISGTDPYFILNILCPQGYTEYTNICIIWILIFWFKINFMTINWLLTNYYYKCIFTKSSWYDYICDAMEFNVWIFNPIWVIIPSIPFIYHRRTVILTCHNYDGVSNGNYIHGVYVTYSSFMI